MHHFSAAKCLHSTWVGALKLGNVFEWRGVNAGKSKGHEKRIWANTGQILCNGREGEYMLAQHRTGNIGIFNKNLFNIFSEPTVIIARCHSAVVTLFIWCV